GRRTGIPRTTALLAVPLDGGFVVTGSNWGRAATPAWAWNLGAADRAQVRIGARTSLMRVHRVPAAKRASYGSDIVHCCPGYAMAPRLAQGRRVPISQPLPDGAAARPEPPAHPATPTGDDTGGGGDKAGGQPPA